MRASSTIGPCRSPSASQETAACSKKIFPEFNRTAELPTGELVLVEFLPEKSGEYEFTCGMGMLRGRLVVR
jgi:plastocyanin domain-containing protein